MLHFIILILAFTAVAHPAFSRDAFVDDRIQSPTLAAPGKGTISGKINDSIDVTAGITQGDLSISLFTPVEDRAPILFNPFPSYSASAGLSEWGMGWRSNLSIKRFNRRHSFDYKNDQFTSIYGLLTEGNDGFYYPQDLKSRVRVRFEGNRVTAYLSDGSVHEYQAYSDDEGRFSEYYIEKARQKEGFTTSFIWDHPEDQTPLLQRITYGAWSESGTIIKDPVAKIQFIYEPVGSPVISYRFGYKSSMTQRIKEVILYNINGVQEVEKQRHIIDYTEDQTGPAFYLRTLETKLSSGKSLPIKTFSYDLPADYLSGMKTSVSDTFKALIKSIGFANVSLLRMGIYDADKDGLTEIESARDYSTWTFDGNAYVATGSPVRSIQANLLCMPGPSSVNRARQIIRLHPHGDPVVIVRYSNNGNFIKVCNLEGELLYDLSMSQALSGNSKTRMTDLNRDGRPDFIKIMGSVAKVFINETDIDQVSFREITVPTPASLKYSRTVYLEDLNGDQNIDIIGITSTAVQVFYGLGDLRFTQVAKVFPFRSKTGAKMNIGAYDFRFIDVNRDGYKDVLLSRSDRYLLCLNSGENFTEWPTPLIPRQTFGGEVLIGDYTDSGIIQIIKPMPNGESNVLNLSRASTHLLKSFDNGRGETVEFVWDQSGRYDGLKSRPTVIRKIKIIATGKEDETVEYKYLDPMFYSDTASFIAFSQVTKTSKDLTVSTQFQHGDSYSNLQIAQYSSSSYNKELERFSEIEFGFHDFEGLKIPLAKTTKSGFRHPKKIDSPQVAISSITYYDNYCPKTTTLNTNGNQLETRYEYFQNMDFENHLTCWERLKILQGAHPLNPAFDFTYELRKNRNALGQIEQLSAISKTQPLVLQDISYDSYNRVDGISDPSGASVAISYKGHGLLLHRMIDENGVVLEVARRDEVTDLIESVQTSRGPADFQKFFTYGDLELLKSEWNSFYPSDEIDPIQSFSYKFADKINPGTVTSEIHKSTDSVLTTRGFETADGSSLGKARGYGDQWVFDQIKIFQNSQNQTISLMTNLTFDKGEDLSITKVADSGNQINKQFSAALGMSSKQEPTYEEGISGSLSEKKTLTAEGTLKSTLNKQGYIRDTTMDDQGSITRIITETGKQYFFQYDSLKRLRRVETPAGDSHTVDYDGFSRVIEVNRSNVGRITYSYNGKNQLEVKNFFDRLGKSDRQEVYSYDAQGRIRDMQASKGNVTSHYEYGYDGERFHGTPVVGQQGFPGGVRSSHYESEQIFNPDETLKRQRTEFYGHRIIEKLYTYHRDKSPKTMTMVIKNSLGQQLSAWNIGYSYGTSGELTGVTSNDGSYLRVLRDSLGLIQRIDFADGQFIRVERDPVTRQVKTRILGRGSLDLASYSFGYSSRGLIEYEDFLDGVNGKTKTYEYRADEFLDQYSDNKSTYSYRYDDEGLLEGHAGPFHQFDLQPSSLDSLNRLTERNGWNLTWGPLGQIREATSGTEAIQFYYDQDGIRNLKTKNGSLTYLRSGALWITEDESFELINLEGLSIAAIHNGKIIPLFTDSRGSLLADGKELLEYTPFGFMPKTTGLARFVSYAQKGYDRDLKIVRMGIRDYDPSLGRFISPDPLFLESPELCIKSPIECNLYSYARNNPLIYTDPTGKNARRPNPPGQTQSQVVNALSYRSLLREIRRVEPGYDTIRGSGPVTRREVNSLRRNLDQIRWKQNPTQQLRGASGHFSRFLRNKIQRINNQTAAGGNKGVSGSVTYDQARKLGENFVGPGFKMNSQGNGLVSRDGLRSFRFPAPKTGRNPATGEPWSRTGNVVNFETKAESGRPPVSNVHLDVK